jgi:hypothetical protein
VSTVAEYTLSEMILLAAHRLEEHGQSPFSAEELIVASWKQFPRAFGLKGYHEQYPDSNRVLSSIMGEKGLARKGWLVKMGQKLYALTKEGQRVVRRMVDGFNADEVDEEPTPARLPREQEKLVLGLLDSTAANKFLNKKSFELVFGDACRFWSIHENMSGEALDERLAVVEKTLAFVDRLAAKGSLELGSRDIGAADVELLHDVHDHLLDRFSRHLNVWRSRQ